MNANQLLATASSAVYQTQAMRQADAAARAQQGAAAQVPSEQELRKSERSKQSPALSFSDVYASQVSLSSYAFAMLFGVSGEDGQAQEGDLPERGYRQYSAAQQENDKQSAQTSAQENTPEFEVAASAEAPQQEVLPPLRFFQNQNNGKQNAAPQMNTTLGGFVLDEFALARISYNKATEFRQRAFASPAQRESVKLGCMDVGLLKDIFLNSLVSWLFIPVKSEIYWFSLRSFHTADMLWPTVVALVGSMLGIMASYLLGWVAALDLKNIPLPEEKYHKASRFANNVMLWFLLIPWWPLFSFFALLFGFLHVRWWRLLLVVLASRLVYYGYYLYY